MRLERTERGEGSQKRGQGGQLGKGGQGPRQAQDDMKTLGQCCPMEVEHKPHI